jgi:hypothetical protein
VFSAPEYTTVAQLLLQRHYGNGQAEIHWLIVIEGDAEKPLLRAAQRPEDKTHPRARVRENVIENSERTRARTTNMDSSGRVSATKYRGHFQQSDRKEDDEKDSSLLRWDLEQTGRRELGCGGAG